MFFLSLLTGCFGSGPAGIWFIEVAYDAEAGLDCVDTITENFTDGYAPSDTEVEGGEWTEDETTTGSDSAMFVQIETTAPGEAILVIGNSVYPGTWSSKTWTFEWAEERGTQSSATHRSGYTFTESTARTSTVTLQMVPDGADNATGTIDSNTVDETAWTESDEWNDTLSEQIGTTGQMPSDLYLVYDDRDRQAPQSNTFDVVDCDDVTCRLTVDSTCAGTNDFTAMRTDYADEDAYGHLGNVAAGG